MEFKNKIIILDDVLSSDECATTIEYYKKNGPTHQWHTFFPRHVFLEEYDSLPVIKKIFLSVTAQLNIDIDIDWCEIVYWPQGAQQDLHYDTSSANTVFTSITYLNDDYKGGKTFFEDDIEFIPKIGRTVCFDGKHYFHGVTEVTEGDRFTLPIWYKIPEKKIESSIDRYTDK